MWHCVENLSRPVSSYAPALQVEVWFWNHPTPDWKVIREADVPLGTQFTCLYGEFPQPAGVACNGRREKQSVRHDLAARPCKTHASQ